MLKIEGKQIVLRDWKLGDLTLYKHWHTGHHPWMDFDGPYYPKYTPSELETHLLYLQERISQQHYPSPRERLVIAHKKKDIILGSVSWYWQSKETLWMSNGIALYDHRWWGKGLGYEALGLWNQYLMDKFPDVVRLDLRTWSGNTGMMKLAEKLGYQQEATFRKARKVQGQYYDGIGYGMLRSEWAAKYPNGFGK